MENLSATEQKDMKQFIESETGRLKMQSAISEFTDKCFGKCLSPGNMSRDRLSSSDERCLSNCVGRWLDVNIHIIKNLNAISGN